MSKEFTGNVLKLMSGTVFVQLISLLVQPILLRIYTPADYGLYASITGVILIVSVVAFGCYDRTIVLIEDETDAILFTRKLFKWALLVSFCCGLILLFKYISFHLFFTYLPTPTLTLIMLAIFVNANDVLLGFLSNRLGRYGLLAKRRILAIIVSSTIQLICGLFIGHSYLWLLFGLVCGTTVGTILLSKDVIFTHIKKKLATNYYIKYKDFPLFQMPGIILDTVSLAGMPLFMNIFLGANITGQYALANKVLSIPTVLVASAVGQVFYREFAKRYTQNNNARQFLLDTWKKLFIIGVIPCLILIFFAEPLFVLVFGSKWHLAGWFARYFSIMSFAIFMSSPTGATFAVLGMNRYFVMFTICTFTCRVFSIFCMRHSLILGMILYIIFEIMWIFIYNSLILYKLYKYERRPIICVE